MNCFVRVGILISLLCAASVFAGESCTERIHAVPDYMQTDSAYGGLPGNGSNYCGPVSASNGLIWLSDHGYPNLAPRTEDRKHDQFVLARTLGEEYMDSIDGTSPRHFCRGLKRYIEQCEYSCRRLEYQGWRTIDRQFRSGVTIPDLEWIKAGIRGNCAVWGNVGWYTYDEASDSYTRIGGHWITLVGYGYDGESENPDYLIAHDSAPRAGSDFDNEYVRTEVIEGGTLEGKTGGLPRDAEGYCKLTDGMHLNRRADVGILDCAVILEMDPVESEKTAIESVRPVEDVRFFGWLAVLYFLLTVF